MKIAIVCPYDLYSPGGVQKHILDVAAELRKRGHNVKIIAPRCATGQKDSDNVIFLGKSRKIEFNKTRFDISIVYGKDKKRLVDTIRQGDFDVIHYHTIWTPFLPLQTLLASRSVNVATFHDTPPDNISGRLTKIVFRVLSFFILRYLDSAIAVSEAPAEHLAKIPGRKIHILPPCIDLTAFSPDIKPLIARSDQVVTILFLGRLEQRKGINILIQAFHKLVDQKLNVRLLIAGEGDEAANINRYIKSFNLSQVITLGHIRESDKPSCYTSCDIFCSPALYGESFGIVLVEAMASGRPVIAAANKGYSKLLKPKADLCLAKPGNAEDLYQKLSSLVVNRNLREELGQWGVEEAKKYHCNNLINQYIDIYQGALDFKR
jgi:phosphatidylinositol alpha-mannosyltransferase